MNKADLNYPTQKEAQEYWQYDADTGIFISNITYGPWTAGHKVGYKNHYGYVYLKFKQWEIPAHRIAWLYVYGVLPPQIDHINQDKSDNRLCNLRSANAKKNGANRGKQKNNTSGYKGVTQYHRNPNKWIAQITVNQENHYLGIHDTRQEAHEAYLSAAEEYFGEFACG